MTTPCPRRSGRASMVGLCVAFSLTALAGCDRDILFGTLSPEDHNGRGNGSAGAGRNGSGSGGAYVGGSGGAYATGGSEGASGGATGGAGVEVTPGAGNPAAASGVWTGHFVDPFQFPSGSDLITFTVSVAQDGVTSVQVVFGGGAVPAPPANPDVGWPPNLTYDNPSAIALPVLEAAIYEARDVRWESGRLKFTLSRWEPWQAWCGLQQVYPSTLTGTGYGCLPPGILKRDSAGQCFMAATLDATVGAAINCERGFPLCVSTPAICACDVNVCTFSDLRTSFDLVLGDVVGAGETDLLVLTNGPADAELRLTHNSHQ